MGILIYVRTGMTSCLNKIAVMHCSSPVAQGELHNRSLMYLREAQEASLDCNSQGQLMHKPISSCVTIMLHLLHQYLLSR